MRTNLKHVTLFVAAVALAGNSLVVFGQQRPGDYQNSQRRGYGNNRLTGTYRLDPSRSDDVQAVADRATAGLADRERERVRNRIVRRVDSPDQMAIDRQGRRVTIASTSAPQATFEANGPEQVETLPNGRQMRVSASLQGDRLEMSYLGDRANDYYVTFVPTNNGRGLRVTRRFYVERLNNQVTVQSFYNKTSEVATLDLRNGNRSDNNRNDNWPNNNSTAAGRPAGGWAVENGAQLVAVLNENLDTKNAREGDRFTLRVQSPGQYRGAVIEGAVLAVDRAGRVSGRSDMTLDFERIRLRDGRSYNFAGTIESVRTPDGQTVRLDNEGNVAEDDSQTQRTVTRTGIGAAIGAVIGAIAGGGTGAAIGAAVGAGTGAGSVIVQGRDDLTLTSGSEFTIRASAPRS